MTFDKQKIVRMDDETINMLKELSANSDDSKVIRDLIRTEWKKRNGIVEIPIVGTLNEKTIIAVGKQGPAFEKGG